MPDTGALHAALVDHLKADGLLNEPRIEAAFRAVPRHLFLPGLDPAIVYADEAIPTKMAEGRPISSSSQPAIMAIMLEQLAPQPGEHVLEIGAGTGYNAALLGHLVGPTGRVVSVDIDDDLVAAARMNLDQAGAGNVEVVRGDGAHGHVAGAPYDRIILTVAASDLAPAWIDQLRPGGRLVLPLAIHQNVQKSVAFDRPPAWHPGAALLTSTGVRDCGFMPLRGAMAGQERFVPLGPRPGLSLITNAMPVSPGEVYAWLVGPARDLPAGVRVSRREIFQGLGFWCSLHLAGYATLAAEGDLASEGLVPCLFKFGEPYSTCITFGLLASAGLAVLLPPHAGSVQSGGPFDEEGSFELAVRAYDSDPGGAVASRLIDTVVDWDAAGRRGSMGMRLRVYRPSEGHPGEAAFEPGAVSIAKRWNRLVVDWPGGAQTA